ncbi:MAG: hypothetical protein M1818_003949 [Claussenomyces sp. TS43310]|nr:MAG: hypothetical protein M1818_003949 [Claussenomyces sp. TS43310]
MHFSISAITAVAASLLVKDVLAAHVHRHQHPRDRRQIVTDETMVTVTDIVWVTVDWPGESSTTSSAEPTTTTSVHTTVSNTITVSSSTASPSSSAKESVAATTSAASSATPSATPELVQAAEVEGQTSSSSSSSSSAATSAPTTLVTIIKPSTTSTPSPTTSSTTSSTFFSSSAAASPTTSASSGSSSSGGKAGVPYNSAALAEVFQGTKVSWAYNWGSSSDGLSSSLDFVPMLWCPTSDFTSTWTANADAALAAGATHLLGFNEPDLSSQCNIAASDAAAGWKQYMEPYAGKAKLVSPAVTNGGSPLGLDYLSSFISACNGCSIDAVAIHWYDSATNIDYFKSHVADAYAAGDNRPVWVTEFGASGSDDEVASFLSTVIPWMESSDMVERYAYFMASDGLLLSGSSLSSIGQAFAG